MPLMLKYALVFTLAGMTSASLPLSLVRAAAPGATNTEPALSPSLSLAQRLEAGQKLASAKCASCHSIKKAGDSPNKEAPPFRTFAQKWPLESLEESLAEGIVTGHQDMPEFVLTPPEIDAFLIFLGSLQKD